MCAAKEKTYQELLADVETLKNVIADKDNVIAFKQQRIEQLEEFLKLGRAKQFGASTEKSPDQHEMFNEAELSVAAEDVLLDQEALRDAQQSEPKPQKKPGRKLLPSELPRIRIEHDLTDAEKQCSCGCERTVIGEEISEQLDIVPAKVQVLVHVRKKYACRQCEEGVKTAPLPPQPIPKSNASPSTLAYIAAGKYVDGVPLYRLEAGLNRSGIDIPRNTLANWMMQCGELIQPLINLLEEILLSYPIIQCDETVVQVLNEPDKPPESQSYMWVRNGGPPRQLVRLFHYADSRKGEVAARLFESYQGYLQSDDYAGYHVVSTQAGIIHLGCWAHARRKFIDAQKAAVKGKNRKAGKADMAVSLIAKLYAIESRIKPLSTEEKCAIRQREAVPAIKKIRAWLDKTLHTTLPKGLLGKALGYLDKNWDKLTIYTQDGRLSIDNNGAENAIRPFVIGRKNWLFSASVRGAKSSANLYSLIETAKANGLEPYAYLRHVFKELPKATNIEEIDMLLPWKVDGKTIAVT